jgi:hypothetical protein
MDGFNFSSEKSFNYIFFITAFFATYSLLNLIYKLDYYSLLRGYIVGFVVLIFLLVIPYLLTVYLPENLHTTFYIISALLLIIEILDFFDIIDLFIRNVPKNSDVGKEVA